MAKQREQTEDDAQRALPLPRDVWRWVAAELDLAPRQRQAVKLLLCGCQDRDIAATMHIGLPTLRTYLTRIFARIGVANRLELVLHIMALAHQHPRRCPHCGELVIANDDIK